MILSLATAKDENPRKCDQCLLETEAVLDNLFHVPCWCVSCGHFLCLCGMVTMYMCTVSLGVLSSAVCVAVGCHIDSPSAKPVSLIELGFSAFS